MLNLKFKGSLRKGLSAALFLMTLSASGSLFAQTLPALGGSLPNTSELLNVGLVFGGNLLQGTPLQDTLFVPGVAVVFGDTVIGAAAPSSSASSGASVLEFVDTPALAK